MPDVLSPMVEENFPKFDLAKSFNYEWIDTNGKGGYSSSTISGINSRKYHGLLVACLGAGLDKVVALSKFDESLIAGKKNFALSYHHYYPNFIVPDPEANKIDPNFCQSFHPKWLYKADDFELEKELMMLSGKNAVLIKYHLKASQHKDLKLKLKPLLAFRSFHHTCHANEFFDFNFEKLATGIALQPYQGSLKLSLEFSENAVIEQHNTWYQSFRFIEEEKRGYPAAEDLACIADIELKLETGKPVYVLASCETGLEKELGALWADEFSRRQRLHKMIAVKSHNMQKPVSRALRDGFKSIASIIGANQDDHSLESFIEELGYSGMQFVIQPEPDEFSVVAGYHWFREWGRDTMISLPGLLLNTGREEIFKKVLKRFLRYERDGLIPNIIGEPCAYNSVDASLWMFWVIQQFAEAKNSYQWIKDEFWEDLKRIFNAYADSKPEFVTCLDNGLIYSGSFYDSLTWMDACQNGQSVIPRYGCIVDINALWYNAVSFMEALADIFADQETKVRAKTIQIKAYKAFNETFYREGNDFLGDFWNENGLNMQLRPNQIFAVSLPFSPVPKELAVKIVNICEQELLTPAGMRTLSSRDISYRGTYNGDVQQRDSAYHNGTVWPWLFGHFGEALLKTSANRKEAEKKIKTILLNFQDHLNEAGIGSISEIFDGDEPQIARGCIAQAWSVAELRRLAMML